MNSHLGMDWASNPRWAGVTRPYTMHDVERLRGSLHIECTLARHGAERLWQLLHGESHVAALGAMTGNQAIQQVKAGLQAIYVSGWQVAADANDAGQMYPDQSLYPADSVPNLVRRINQALTRADQIHHAEGKNGVEWFAPLVADAEAGFGGNLNAFELMKAMIEAGAACVHFEDQLSSAKKCGHLGGKVLVPTARDFLTGNRTAEGFFCIRGGLDSAIARGMAYAPYADLIWCETSEPNLEEARRFADAIHVQHPDKMLAYNCSPSFNWKKKLDDATIARFQTELATMGYKFQFITLAGFHALNLSMFELARGYKASGMSAYSRLQEKEFGSAELYGYEAVKHQRFVGTGYFDMVTQVIASGNSSTTALAGSTEAEQFAAGKSHCWERLRSEAPRRKARQRTHCSS